jgi:hypothetical protein
MITHTSKKSPRAPSIPLEDAINKALTIYDKDRRNPTSIEIMAQHMGYKDAKNGAALGALASLKYYGLLEKISNGKLAVTKDVESYKFAPTDQLKSTQLIDWLKTPPIFMELLTKYQTGLPSEATLKYDLIQKGFSSEAANICLQTFVRSVNYAKPMLNGVELTESNNDAASKDSNIRATIGEPPSLQNPAPQFNPVPKPSNTQPGSVVGLSEEIGRVPTKLEIDRIPVRLSGGRRAWIEVPIPFYNLDKERLIAQINLLITDDSDE